jgi:tetratricopeptide (TPR) repeat protein
LSTSLARFWLLVMMVALTGCRTPRGGLGAYEYEEQPEHIGGLRLDRLTYQDASTKERVSALWSRIQQQPGDADARFELSRILLRNQYPAPAISLLNHASCRDAHSPQYYLLLANALQSHAPANLPRTTALLEEGVKAFPKNGQLHTALGHALNTGERPAEALGEFDKALRLSAPAEVILSAHLGKASSFRKQGKEQAARNELAEARRIYPDLAKDLEEASIAGQLKQLELSGTPVDDGIHPLPRERAQRVREEIERVNAVTK